MTDSHAIENGSARTSRRGQRGISLLFALMALVVISLAAVALVRSVDTSALVIGNLGFKQDATSAASQAAERAVAFLTANAGANLQNDNADVGYYASSRDTLDVTGQGSNSARAVVDWTGDGKCSLYAVGSYGLCVKASDEISLNGGANTARYIITRLCATEGAPAAIDCAVPTGSAMTGGGNKGTPGYGAGQKAQVVVVNSQYYRIVVRATSARGTVSFTETMVQL